MKQILGFTICLSVLLAIAVVPAFCGEVIDGIVATVNRQPLLRSDWDEAVCFEAFMQQKRLSAVTESDRVLALQRLIDRQLLKAQMGNANYMQPSDDELLYLKEIGAQYVSVGSPPNLRTAEGHRAALMRKMNFESLSDLVRYAVRNRIIDL